MRWPWRRFEVFFDRHLLRKARVAIEAQRDALIAAINANPNYDGQEASQAKIKRIEDIQEVSAQAIEQLYDRSLTPEKENDPFESDPLFKSMKSSVSSGKPRLEQEGMGHVLMGE